MYSDSTTQTCTRACLAGVCDWVIAIVKRFFSGVTAPPTSPVAMATATGASELLPPGRASVAQQAAMRRRRGPDGGGSGSRYFLHTDTSLFM